MAEPNYGADLENSVYQTYGSNSPEYDRASAMRDRGEVNSGNIKKLMSSFKVPQKKTDHSI